MKKLLPVLLAVVLGLLLLMPTVSLAQETADDIAKLLVCQCGCNSVLANCVHGECMVRDEMMGAIGNQLAQGKTPPQIIQAFVQQYGEEVLAAPTKKGFNLTAWITPFVALVAGGVAIYFIVQRWATKGQQQAPAPRTTPKQAEANETYLRRVEEELAKFKGGTG